MIRQNKILLLLLLLLFFLTPISSLAQSIRNIEIEGNITFTDSEISEWLSVFPGVNFQSSLIDTIKKNISSELSDRGYLHSDININRIEIENDTSKVDLQIIISEGEPTFIKNVIIEEVDSLFNAELSSRFEFLEGEILNKSRIEEVISEALTLYENSGFPFINIVVQSINVFKDTINNENYADVHLKLERGASSRIDKIELRGNSSTKDYVIIRELRIEKGEYYAQERIEEFPKRLNRLRFFDPVPKPQFYLNSENEGVLLIDVKEKQTNNFDGIIGYIPPKTEDETGYLTGLVNVSLRNLFGTGRAAAIRWQQFDRNSQELQLKYLEPWLLGYPFNINAELYQRKQDTIYVQRKVEGGVEYLATEDISASVFVSSESVIPTETPEPVFTVYNSSSLTTGVNLKFDTRDDPYAPTEGFYFLNSYSYSQKTINGPKEFITPETITDIGLQRFTLSLNFFYLLFSRQVIALGVNGRELRGSFFEDSDLFRLGGTNSLRGYREEQFLASRILWSNLEYRLLLTPRTYAFLFFDTGYYLRNADADRNILKQEDFLIGYGLGLNVETALGILGVSFALGEGDSFSEGKIHFGIVNEF